MKDASFVSGMLDVMCLLGTPTGSNFCTIHRLPNLAPLPVSGCTVKFNHRRWVSSEAQYQGLRMNRWN